MINGVSSAHAFYQSRPQAQTPSPSAEQTTSNEQALKQVKADNAGDTELQTPEATVKQKDDATKVKEELEKQSTQAKAPNGESLSEDEVRELDQLKQRDQEVRAHEAAHLAAAGQHARGGMSFSYKNGPDGRRYAVGGEVNVDTSPVSGDPQATLQKANTIRAAAMAPAEPSAQDRAVAAEATQMAAQARQDIAQEQTQAMKDSREKMNEDTEAAVKDADSDGDEQNPNQGSLTAKQASNNYQQVSDIDNKPAKSLKIDLSV